jgi:hypothetical protein
MHGVGMFDNPEICYLNNPVSHVFDESWIIDKEKIAKLKDHKLVVLNFSSEHYGQEGLDHVYSALDKNHINFLLLTHDPLDNQKYPRMFFNNYWYHWSIQKWTKISQQQKRQWAWSCLNGNPRPHRIYNFLYSRQQEYFSQACFTILKANDFETRADDIQLDVEMQGEWNSIKHTLLDRYLTPARPNKPGISRVSDVSLNLPALTDSYIHLVTETTVSSKIFISEKTWKPVASSQFFLVFGNAGSIEFLRSLGVDVFDDIINHDYDQDPDWQSRLFKIHKEIKRLIDTGIYIKWRETQQRRQSNYDNFWSNSFDGGYSADIKQAVEQYLK